MKKKTWLKKFSTKVQNTKTYRHIKSNPDKQQVVKKKIMNRKLSY